jgi:urease accessory protein
MTRAQKHLLRIVTAGASLVPALALAHPGHGETTSFVEGALHPLGGFEHVIGFVAVGLLAGLLRGRHLWPVSAAFLGLLVAAWTSGGDGWRFAAGFMFGGAGLIAAGVAAIRLTVFIATAGAARSPTWAAGGSPARHPSA